MFAFLQSSEKQDFDPTDFCFSFKDFEGKSVNTSVQQDAQEFLNMMFDKVERSISNTPFK